MSDTYTKLFSSITASTIWQEPAGTRLTWITMLAMARKDGCVYASIPGLAHQANVTIAEVEVALRCFLSPDPYSRTKDNDGRRVEEIDGGWRLLNHAKFGAMRDEVERAVYKREWDRNNRAGRRSSQPGNNPTKSDTPDTNPTVTTNATGATPLALALTPEDQEPPCSPPLGDSPPAGKKPRKARAIPLATYLADCETRGAEPIPESDAVWRTAEGAGLPREWVALAWWAFQGRYLANPGDKAKTYASWPQAFRNAVRENWLKLWWPTDDGGYRLSPAGVQAQREMERAA